jgi:hypothetical protein
MRPQLEDSWDGAERRDSYIAKKLFSPFPFGFCSSISIALRKHFLITPPDSPLRFRHLNFTIHYQGRFRKESHESRTFL